MENVMKYMLLIYGNEREWQGLPESETGQRLAAYRAYTEALMKAGALVAGDRLQHSHTATTVRVEGGKTNVLNGPYAESREQLGGYYLIEAPDLDAALSWAARCPGASHGAIEVRPIWAMGAGTRLTSCCGQAAGMPAMPPSEPRGKAMASWSPFSHTGCAMSPPPRMRSPRHSRRRSPTGPGTASPTGPRRGC